MQSYVLLPSGYHRLGGRKGHFPASCEIFRKQCYLAIEARQDPEALHNFDKWRPYVFNEWKVETVPWPTLQSIPPFWLALLWSCLRSTWASCSSSKSLFPEGIPKSYGQCEYTVRLDHLIALSALKNLRIAEVLAPTRLSWDYSPFRLCTGRQTWPGIVSRWN